MPRRATVVAGQAGSEANNNVTLPGTGSQQRCQQVAQGGTTSIESSNLVAQLKARAEQFGLPDHRRRPAVRRDRGSRAGAGGKGGLHRHARSKGLGDGQAAILNVAPVGRPASEAALLYEETEASRQARERLAALPKDTPLAFLCHHGGRSAQAAEHFRGLGFREVYNVEGGIEAWAVEADEHVPRY